MEAILGKRQHNGSTEYLVKWKEWPNNSWESEETIRNGSKLKERKYEDWAWKKSASLFDKQIMSKFENEKIIYDYVQYY